jgi:hypothetical protein
MFIFSRERDLVGSVTYEGAQHVGREQLLVSGVWLSPEQVVLRVLYVYIGEFNVIYTDIFTSVSRAREAETYTNTHKHPPTHTHTLYTHIHVHVCMQYINTSS